MNKLILFLTLSLLELYSFAQDTTHISSRADVTSDGIYQIENNYGWVQIGKFKNKEPIGIWIMYSIQDTTTKFLHIFREGKLHAVQVNYNNTIIQSLVIDEFKKEGYIFDYNSDGFIRSERYYHDISSWPTREDSMTVIFEMNIQPYFTIDYSSVNLKRGKLVLVDNDVTPNVCGGPKKLFFINKKGRIIYLASISPDGRFLELQGTVSKRRIDKILRAIYTEPPIWRK